MKIKSFGWLAAVALVAIAVPTAHVQVRGMSFNKIVADGPLPVPPGGGGIVVKDGPLPVPPGGGGIASQLFAASLTSGPSRILSDGPLPVPPGGGGIVADGPLPVPPGGGGIA